MHVERIVVERQIAGDRQDVERNDRHDEKENPYRQILDAPNDIEGHERQHDEKRHDDGNPQAATVEAVPIPFARILFAVAEGCERRPDGRQCLF